MISRRLILILGAFALASVSFPASSIAAGADDFIRTAGDRTFKAFKKDLSEEERERRFRVILNETFDVPTIGRFVLGRYWRTATKEQRKEYLGLFEEFVIQAYSHRFKDIDGTVFRVVQSREINARDTLVLSEIITGADAPPVRVNWRVRSSGPNHKVVDVMVEGVSMVVTQRDEFATVIRRSGGKVDGLIEALKQKTGK